MFYKQLITGNQLKFKKDAHLHKKIILLTMHVLGKRLVVVVVVVILYLKRVAHDDNGK